VVEGSGGLPRNGKGKPRPGGPSKNALREEQRLQQAVEEAEAALRAVEDELAERFPKLEVLRLDADVADRAAPTVADDAGRTGSPRTVPGP
jgi:hypothetical protein